MSYERDYIELCHRIIDNGEWIENKRTGKRCLTVIDADFVYTPECAPLLTIKQCFPISATAELIGYLRGYTNAQEFSDIGASTWFKNANETKSWLKNPVRKGENDIGKCYGAIGRDFGGLDLLKKVYENLSSDIDDRGEILTFWKPDEFHLASLRPCVYSHHFSILGNKLHLTSTQRSCDVPLGLNFNSIQCYVFLQLMSKITGYEAGNVYHKIVNAHIYEDQIDQVKEMIKREPLENKAFIKIKDWVTILEDVIWQDLHAKAYVEVLNYRHKGKIDFNMTA